MHVCVTCVVPPFVAGRETRVDVRAGNGPSVVLRPPTSRCPDASARAVVGVAGDVGVETVEQDTEGVEIVGGETFVQAGVVADGGLA